ncbi:unnamed protein product [Rotaria sordida]|uniref:Uncharacterized protein n=2 Tax=Rotaria sordida TaxID=392033 RepID=A0A815VLQ5_9BILA|nr:unnamed protein product [Rotaria sordida]CAF1533682.1 unnamed protein product [Rotaria sordida]CAF4135271.1 unnamed protein product [Rotaria sordida]
MASNTTQCFINEKDSSTEYHQKLIEQMDEIEKDRDLFLQEFIQHKQNLQEHSLMKQIDQWENDSIFKIKERAEKCRQNFIKSMKKSFRQIDYKLFSLNEQLKQIRKRKKFNENSSNELKQKLIKLTKELNEPSHIFIEEITTLFINKINLIDRSNMKWKEFGIDITEGNELNQLKNPSSMLIDKDDDKIIYIVDSQNDRIMKWKLNEHYGETVAGRNGKGKQMNQLCYPKDVIIDKENDCFIISDYGNKRIMQWPRQNNGTEKIIISNINCHGLAIDKYEFIYVADGEKHEVRKWKIGDENGKLVAGGNGKGTNLNQLNHPSFIFVDNDCSLYISDCANHRVMKWLKDAKQGIIVAGGNGEGNSFKQLSGPQGILVDQFNQIYVADHGNNRVMCWLEGTTKGSIIVGGNGYGNELNQLFYPMGLSFDQQENLYVVDSGNNRIQKFEIDFN